MMSLIAVQLEAELVYTLPMYTYAVEVATSIDPSIEVQ